MLGQWDSCSTLGPVESAASMMWSLQCNPYLLLFAIVRPRLPPAQSQIPSQSENLVLYYRNALDLSVVFRWF